MAPIQSHYAHCPGDSFIDKPKHWTDRLSDNLKQRWGVPPRPEPQLQPQTHQLQFLVQYSGADRLVDNILEFASRNKLCVSVVRGPLSSEEGTLRTIDGPVKSDSSTERNSPFSSPSLNTPKPKKGIRKPFRKTKRGRKKLKRIMARRTPKAPKVVESYNTLSRITTPSPTVVDGGEATEGSSTPKKEYVGPCIVDTEKWRQRALDCLATQGAEAKKQAAEKKEADDEAIHLAVAADVNNVYPHYIQQSESSNLQMTMRNLSVPAQYSHDQNYPTGYEQPAFGVDPNTIHYSSMRNGGSPLRSSRAGNDGLQNLLTRWEETQFLPYPDSPHSDNVNPGVIMQTVEGATPSMYQLETASNEEADFSLPTTYATRHSPAYVASLERDMHGIHKAESPANSRELAPSVASLLEASRKSQKSTPKSSPSSMDPAANEALAQSVAALFELTRQSYRSFSGSTGSSSELLINPVASSLFERGLSKQPSSITTDNFSNEDPALPAQTSHPHNDPTMSTSNNPPNISKKMMILPFRRVRTSEDLSQLAQDAPSSPSLYFDAKSKNLSSPDPTSKDSKEASRDTSRKASAFDSHDNQQPKSPASKADTGQIHDQFSQTVDTGPLAFQTKHIQGLFGNPEFSDIQILLSPDLTLPPIVYYVHKNVIAASPFLYKVMAAKRNRDGGVDRIHALTGVSFTCSHAFSMALQVLYGIPLVTQESLRKTTMQGLGHPDDDDTSTYSFSLERAMVDFALCYAATGAFLERREITERGIELAMDLLSWETAEFILNFGMTVSAYAVTCPDVPFPPMSSHSSRSSSLSAANGIPLVELDYFHDFHCMWADTVLTAAVRFITSSITVDFQLYNRAQARFTPNRIPQALHTLPGSCLSNPRLEEIRFGSFPSIADERPTDPMILVPSAMLLTLPFRAFVDMLNAVKSRGALSYNLVKEIVLEREARRLNALRVFLRIGHWCFTEVPGEALEELSYREFVKIDQVDHAEDECAVVLRATVERVWVGNEVPNSVPAAAAANNSA
ncbi:uncharacterized protein N7482_001987 [Penicillium canariense]|uniref:BTB domain-containing protein n=1 Tax=Penicillium canariense TaxID=189055 RepID=A0A9W9IHN1_9EURO|nr:uncharacterized protein N7482_001987 [Penicillium canariense]KAJ5176110.1 hypothetical protein N7482_001987 [Penicillium canariense]